MNTSLRKRRALLGAAPLGLTLASAPAWAQGILKVPQGNLKIELSKVTGASFVKTSGARGSVSTAPNQPIAPVSALSHFEFGFGNGDHKFRRLQLLVDGNMVRAALNDSNEDDPFDVQARWVNFSGGQSGTVSGEGHGRAVTTLRLPPAPAGHMFALRGFEFVRQEGTDANIRTLAVQPVAGGIEVVLSDDEGMDLRGFDGAAAVADPLHFFVVKQSSRNLQPGRRYGVTVQYVWIPESLIASSGTITGSEGERRDAASVPAGRNGAVIRGFRFAFLNSDHHLLRIKASTLNGGMGNFRDNVEDDPMRWRIDYAALRN
jgi:hypothetical protein